MKKKISLLLMFCLLISSFSGVYAVDKEVLNYSIPVSFVNDQGQKITIRDKTYDEYIKDLSEQKGISIEEAVILDKADTKETLFTNGVSIRSEDNMIYREVEVEDSLEENSDFSAILITQLKIYAYYSYRQIENVIWQDIMMSSGGGYDTVIISETYNTDPEKDSSDFPVEEIFISGAAQFQVSLDSSVSAGVDIPGFSLNGTTSSSYIYHSKPLIFGYFYNLY